MVISAYQPAEDWKLEAHKNEDGIFDFLEEICF